MRMRRRKPSFGQPPFDSSQEEICCLPPSSGLRLSCKHKAHPVSLPKNVGVGFSGMDAASGLLPRRCAVCLGEYKEEELLRILPQCGHTFHVNCIDAWLQQHATCPICRMSLQGYFVGRPMAPLQPTPLPTDTLSSGSRTLSGHSDAGSLGSLMSGHTSLPGETLGLENSMVCDGASQLSVSSSQISERQIAHNSVRGLTDRPDSCVVDVSLTHFVERG